MTRLRTLIFSSPERPVFHALCATAFSSNGTDPWNKTLENVPEGLQWNYFICFIGFGIYFGLNQGDRLIIGKSNNRDKFPPVLSGDWQIFGIPTLA
jgi:hypothetical protein